MTNNLRLRWVPKSTIAKISLLPIFLQSRVLRPNVNGLVVLPPTLLMTVLFWKHSGGHEPLQEKESIDRGKDLKSALKDNVAIQDCLNNYLEW